MKKVCVITGARSEYGLLRWVIDGIDKDEDLQLQLVVTGGHLSPEQGLTYQAIEEDGYHIDEKVEMLLSSETSVGISKSMGLCSIGMADAFNRLKPDMIVVLGDRYELLPIVGTALVMRIPVAHISGGDITEGAIDNEVRNAVTMMSALHFPGTEESAARIRAMRQSPDNIYVTGETNLDNFRNLTLLSKKELALSLGIDENKKWILFTYHPVTKESLDDNMKSLQNILKVIDELGDDFEVLIGKANTDLYGNEINQYLGKYVSTKNCCHLFASLGQLRYTSILQHLYCMIGNSSSGIYETGYWKLPTINVGDRQKGRFTTANIINVGTSYSEIKNAFNYMDTDNYREKMKMIVNPYGDGKASKRIVKYIKKYFYEV